MALNIPNLEAATFSETGFNNTRQAIIGGSNTNLLSNNTQVIGPSNNTVTISPSSGKLFLKDNPVSIKEIIIKNTTGVITANDLSDGIINLQSSGTYTLDSTINIRNRIYDNSGTPFVGSIGPMFEATLYNTSAGNIIINPGTGQTFTNTGSVSIISGECVTLKFWLTSSTTMNVERIISNNSTTTLTSAGGTVSLVNNGTGPTLINKGLTSGTDISLIDGGTQITINNSSPASTVSLGSAGGAVSLVNDGIGPALANKGLTAGTGINLVDGGTQVTITNTSPASTVTLSDAAIPAGNEAGLVVDGTGPTLSIKKLGGSGIILTNNANDVVISSIIRTGSSGVVTHDRNIQQIITTVNYSIPFGTTPSTVIGLNNTNISTNYLEKRLINYSTNNETNSSFDAVVNLKANHIVTVDDSANVGRLETSLTVVNGKPGIAYYDTTNTNLKFARNSNVDGMGTWLIQTIDNFNATGQFPSLAIIDGHPAVSYRYDTPDDLAYIRANDKDGTSWPTTGIILDTPGNVGLTCSLKEIDGAPCIAYLDNTNKDLKFIRANDSTGSSWPTIAPGLQTIDNLGGVLPSMVVVDGNPAVAHYDDVNGNLRYIRANDSTGTVWGAGVVVDNGGGDDVGGHPSLVVVDGNPAISYYDVTNGNLKYIRANDSIGSSWPTTAPGLQVLDSVGDVGNFSSITIVDGNPAISYYDRTNGDLKYIRANDSTGTLWPTTAQIVDNNGDVGARTSLAVIDGNPAISYHDVTNRNLKFARSGLKDNFAEDATYNINYFAST